MANLTTGTGEVFNFLVRTPSDYTVLKIDARLGYLATAFIGVGLIVLSIWVLSRSRASKKVS